MLGILGLSNSLTGLTHLPVPPLTLTTLSMDEPEQCEDLGGITVCAEGPTARVCSGLVGEGLLPLGDTSSAAALVDSSGVDSGPCWPVPPPAAEACDVVGAQPFAWRPLGSPEGPM